MTHHTERRTGWLGPIVIGLLIMGLVGGAAVWISSQPPGANGPGSFGDTPQVTAYSSSAGSGGGYTETGTGVAGLGLVTEAATGCQFLVGRTGSDVNHIETLPCEARNHGQ